MSAGRENPWYRKPLRIAAQHWSREEARRGGPADRWSRLGFTMRRGGPRTGFNVEQLLLHLDSPVFGSYLKRAKAHGMRIILYLNVHQIKAFADLFADSRADAAAWEADNSRRWAQRRADGSFGKNYGTQNMICLNSPWRDQFLRHLNRLAPFPVDGVFLDGPSLAPGCCYCRHCRAQFRREFHAELTEKTDRAEFDRRSTEGFFRDAYRAFKAVKPDGVFYMNLNVMHPHASHCPVPGALEYNDLVGTEGGFMFYGPPRNGYLWKPSLAAKLLEAVAPDRPRVIFMAADQKPWNFYQHTPVETTLCIASTVANGASVWYGSMPSFPEIMDRPGVKAAWRLMRRLADNEACYALTSSAAKVALLYSYDTDRSYPGTMEESDLYAKDKRTGPRPAGNSTESFQGFYDMLARSSLPFDVVTDLSDSLERLGRYDCLILPTCACLSDRTLAAVRRFVREGGRLIATHETSLFDEKGNRRPDFGLADVLGVSRQGEELACAAFNYVQVTEEDKLFDGIPIVNLPAPAIGMNVRTLGRAEVLARFRRPMAGRYDSLYLPPTGGPAIVRNRFGKGVSLYLAGTFGEMAASYNPDEYRTLVRNAVRMWAKQPVRLEGALGNVEMTVRIGPGRMMVHLINYAGLPPRPFTRVSPQAGLRLCVREGGKFRRARTVLGKGRCALRRQGSRLWVVLPPLEEYEVVVLE